MPRFAVMTFMFKPLWTQGQTTIPQLLELFAKSGVEGVEPFQRDFVENPALLPDYRRWISDLGLSVPCVDVMCNLALANPAERQANRDALRQGLDICKELGASIAHVAGHKNTENLPAHECRQRIAEDLLAVADLAQSYGLTLAFEDFPIPGLIASREECRELLDLCKGKVKFVFDTGNFIAAGQNAIDAFPLLADDTCHIHIKDFKLDPSIPRGFRGTPLTQGDIPNEQVGQLFSQRGYDQWVALETSGGSVTTPAYAMEHELPLLRKWFR